MPTESTPRTTIQEAARIVLLVFASLVLGASAVCFSTAQEISHPRLMTGVAGIDSARKWVSAYPWYRNIVAQHKADIDRFIARRPV